MSGETDETRRAFLIRLAKTAAFVPPAVATVDVRDLFAQGKSTTSTTSTTTTSSSSGKTSSTTSGGTTVGSISPTSQRIDQTEFSTFGGSEPAQAPWETRAPGQPPPWARPPPEGS